MIAIYTAIYGDFDNIKSHCMQLEDTKFILYTDKYNNRIPKKYKSLDTRMQSKYFKIQPHKLKELKDCEYSIWIDGACIIISPYFASFMVEQLGNKNLAVFQHPEDRDCIFQEINFCKDWEKYIHTNMRQEEIDYRKAGMPEHFGLQACTIFVRRHYSEDCIKFCDAWWKEELKYFSNDQISFQFVKWKQKFRHAIIKENLFKNPYIASTFTHNRSD